LRVDIDRARHTHIAFASGTHRCLGSHLARTELRLALEELHLQIPEYSVKSGDRIKYDNIAVRSAGHLPLEFPAPAA
jgi:cytochrome P450